MTARPCCIYSAAGNQGPIPGLAAAQISKQVQLCWLALSHCLPVSCSACGSAVSPCERLTMSLWIPLQNPKKQQLGLSVVFRGHFLGSSESTVTPFLFPSRHGSLVGWRRHVCSSSPLHKTSKRGLWAHDKAGTAASSDCCQRDSSIRTSIARCA